MNKKQATAHPPTTDKVDPLLYSAGYYKTPDRLAWERTRAVAVLLFGLAAAFAGGWLWWTQDVVWLAAAGGLIWLLAFVYGVNLSRYLHNVEETLWRHETQTNSDIDGDGFIGSPVREIKVQRSNGKPETIVVDLPPNSARRAPPLAPYGVSAADLIAFLFEAETVRGLQERRWIGNGNTFVLPSGGQVTQAVFRQIVQALADQGLAEKVNSRWELTINVENFAAQLAEQA